MYKAKICGIREERHLHAAVNGGASYVGFVFFEKSRRNVSISVAKQLANQVPKDVQRVALMVNPTNVFINKILKSVPIDMLQLHGHENSERIHTVKKISSLPVMKAVGISSKEDLVLVKNYETIADQILLDAKPPFNSEVPGGLGASFDWNILSGFRCKKPWLLAGGLTAKNVKLACQITGAMEFDVSSGVEDNAGIKSEEKILKFLKAVTGVVNAK